MSNNANWPAYTDLDPYREPPTTEEKVADLQSQVDTLKRLVAELILRERVLMRSETFASRHFDEVLWRFLDKPERDLYRQHFRPEE